MKGRVISLLSALRDKLLYAINEARRSGVSPDVIDELMEAHRHILNAQDLLYDDTDL